MLFSRSKSITPSDASAALARGELQLIDVREPSEVTEARVKGARPIPLGQLPTKLGELDRDRPVAFLCRSGSRSAIATASSSTSTSSSGIGARTRERWDMKIGYACAPLVVVRPTMRAPSAPGRRRRIARVRASEPVHENERYVKPEQKWPNDPAVAIPTPAVAPETVPGRDGKEL